MRKKTNLSAPRADSEETPELTGHDAEPAEAQLGSAATADSPPGADLAGGWKDIEEPALAEDILPDQVKQLPEEPAEEDVPLTARPKERPPGEEEEERHAPPQERPELSTPESELA